MYISDKNNTSFPTISVTNYTGRDYLWAKTRNTLQLIYENYIKDYDWFLKADDDTYILVENLKKFLHTKNTFGIEYFGKLLNSTEETGRSNFLLP